MATERGGEEKPLLRIRKLAGLPLERRRRKMVELLLRIERQGRWKDVIDRRYLAGLCRLMADDPGLPEDFRADAEERGQAVLSVRPEGTAEEEGGTEIPWRRWCNDFRHRMMAVTGEVALEGDRFYWDGDGAGAGAGAGAGGRRVLPVDLFLEDIRSPYNLGSAFRTAEGLGVRQIFRSPGSASPDHSRARRAAMGTLERLPGEVCAAADLPGDRPLVALETGGAPLAEFTFPPEGILAVGSEELGLSAPVLDRARREGGVVSLPMRGGEASLNVSVALGIALYRWTEVLERGGGFFSGGGPFRWPAG